jgi:dihydrofolate reductase
VIISLIVAMDRNRAIGLAGSLPWHLPADLKRFRELTTGHHLLIGRKTYASIGRPLPQRTMIVITHDPDYRAPGCQVEHSVTAGIELARASGEEELFVGGGAAIYAQCLDLADRIYLTLVDTDCQADTFFPELKPGEWREEVVGRQEADDRNPFPIIFKLLRRVAAKNTRDAESSLS